MRAPRTRFRVRPVAALALLAAFACVHAREVEPSRGEGPNGAGAVADPEEAPFPHIMFRDGAIRGIQEALRARGHAAPASGQLDPETQEALRAFQGEEGLPQTGFPDHETLRRLELDPEALYRTPAEVDLERRALEAEVDEESAAGE